MRNDNDHEEPLRSTRTPTRFEEDVQAITATTVADARAALKKARHALDLALRELNYLRERGAAGLN